jgi:DNA gyrase subunit A
MLDETNRFINKPSLKIPMSLQKNTEQNTGAIAPTKTGTIIPTNISTELSHSFLSYAMSVIVSRALPDVRDGLKPVHRRILFAMHELGLASNKPYKKSARIVGEVLGKYHPHGDSAVYESMVRMAQDFSLRYPLVDGQGNFGSIDGDNAAAMRYTEARLGKIAEDLLSDLDKETVDFKSNFDESLQEPTVLPSKIPHLLVNGTVGIAVGMATNIPPHNLQEIGQALITLIDNPTADEQLLIAQVSGPDFPTGGIIYGKYGIQSAYKTGYGKIYVRAKMHTEQLGTKQAIIVDEIPYQVNKSMLIEQIADCVKNKVIEDISDIRDESDREGMRIVIELKRDAVVEIVQNLLFKHSRLAVSYSINNLCLVNNTPKVLSLKELLTYFLEHRYTVVTKRTQFELTKAQARKHILEGLKRAIEQLDRSIKIIRESSTTPQAKSQLMTALTLDDIQASAILDMKLQRLTSMEREKIIEEEHELTKIVSELNEILANPAKIYSIIKTETIDCMNKYATPRKTEIVEGDLDVDIEDLIENRDDVVTISNEGYIKRTSLAEYRAQKRGGKGVIAATTKDTDFIVKVIKAHTKAHLLFFTNFGQVHWLKTYKIPEGNRQSKGKAIVNLLSLQQGEKIQTVLAITEYSQDKSLILCTKNGIVKKSNLMDFAHPRVGGIRAIKLLEGDELITAQITNGNNEIILATKLGIASRFHEEDAREVGRVSQGVRGIRLDDADEVVSMVVVDPTDTTQSLLTITQNGFGKRTQVSEYRLINRGGKGVINIQTTQRNGPVVGVLPVTNDTGILVITKGGITLRTIANQMNLIGRNTQGVRIIRLDQTDLVVSCTTLAQEELESLDVQEQPPLQPNSDVQNVE